MEGIKEGDEGYLEAKCKVSSPLIAPSFGGAVSKRFAAHGRDALTLHHVVHFASSLCAMGLTWRAVLPSQGAREANDRHR
eukprot:3061224-Rhodomonas_salina.2